MEGRLTPKQKYKLKVKMRIEESNRREEHGLSPDPWVVEFRNKNNIIKAKWKAKQPRKPHMKKVANSGSFKKGMIPHNKLSDGERHIANERSRERVRQWHRDNKERVNRQRREKRRQNPEFRIACNLRKRLSFLLRKSIVSKTEQTFDLLGCTMEELMQHLKNKFTEGMCFDNYGEWHIDHIIPCASFDLTKEEERRVCFHHSNLQPLWGKENRRKSNRLLNEGDGVYRKKRSYNAIYSISRWE